MIPFLPLPINVAKRLSSPFRYSALLILKFMPGLKAKLSQADIDIEPRDYAALCLFSATFFSLIIFALIFFLGTIGSPIKTAFVTALVLSLIIFFTTFLYALFYPNFIIQKRVRLLDRDLLFALKYILIKIKSGVPLFDAMVGVAQGNYGEVSNEFKKAIKEISTGTEDVVALENMALRSPSPFFRRTIWQITNNLRAGSDIASTLESITSTLVKEQKILIRKYGSELNPIILMYMMFTIIIPSLGVTVMIVMSSFSGLSVPIFIFYILPVVVLVLQIIFMIVIKDKKPMISLGV